MSLSSPKGAQNRKVAVFCWLQPCVSKKVCNKVSFCENCQRQSCRAFADLSNRAQIIGGGHPHTDNFVHNFAAECCIILVKYGSEFNHVTPDVRQSFKVKCRRSRSARKRRLIAKFLLSISTRCCPVEYESSLYYAHSEESRYGFDRCQVISADI